MAIFGVLSTESVVQVGDKTRLSGIKTFITQDEAPVTLVEIQAEAAAGFIDVTNDDQDLWFLDWIYSTAGSKTVSLRITTDGAPQTFTHILTSITEADDKLFSTDQELAMIEPEVLKYVPKGKASFKYVHRQCQSEILEHLYTNGYVKTDNTRITKDEVIRIEEVSYWSRFMALRYIYRQLSNAVDDIYDQKSKRYENDEHKWRHKAILKLDFNGDGTQGEYESANLTSKRLVRI